MEILSAICNVIIITGSVLVAVKTIAEWCGKPIRFFKKKSDDNFDARVEAVIKKTLPNLLEQHDKDLEQARLQESQKQMENLKNSVLQSITQELTMVNMLAEQYKPLVISAKDVLREKIMNIYYKNKDDRTLSLHEQEALEQYYKDYKAMKGNSYIDKYYARMITWKVNPDEYDDRVL